MKFPAEVLDKALAVKRGEATLADLPATERAVVHRALIRGGGQLVQRAREVRDAVSAKHRFTGRQTSVRAVVG